MPAQNVPLLIWSLKFYGRGWSTCYPNTGRPGERLSACQTIDATKQDDLENIPQENLQIGKDSGRVDCTFGRCAYIGGPKPDIWNA